MRFKAECFYGEKKRNIYGTGCGNKTLLTSGLLRKIDIKDRKHPTWEGCREIEMERTFTEEAPDKGHLDHD